MLFWAHVIIVHEIFIFCSKILLIKKNFYIVYSLQKCGCDISNAFFVSDCPKVIISPSLFQFFVQKIFNPALSPNHYLKLETLYCSRWYIFLSWDSFLG